ncbi:MAG: hypothetical protein NVSMB6_03180 [Burkholderiaceae bacterium]
MQRYPPFVPFQRGTAAARPAREAADFLRAHDKMAALMPSVTRMVALQKACATALPSMFDTCVVLQFEEGQLVLSTPTAALASRLKQQAPKLQETLLAQGWQVHSIRLKVQVVAISRRAKQVFPPTLPSIATVAFTQLGAALPDSPRNHSLKAAIEAMVRRQK